MKYTEKDILNIMSAYLVSILEDAEYVSGVFEAHLTSKKTEEIRIEVDDILGKIRQLMLKIDQFEDN